MEISVRAIPAPGHEYRRRAGRAWGKAPVVARVVEKPDLSASDPIEVSPADLGELQADPHIAVVPLGGLSEDLDAKVKIARLEEEVARLRGDLAQAVEAMEAVRESASKDMEAAGAKIRELEAELDKARAQLAKRGRKGSEE